MNNDLDFETWGLKIAAIFWANGRFWDANQDFLEFMYEDDATPEEVFDVVMEAYGY